MLRHLTLALALCAALTACGGGGSSSSSLPPAPGTPSSAGPQSVTMSIKIPAAATSTGAAASTRRPLYVSAGTQSAAIAINGGTPVVVNLAGTSPNCVTTPSGRTCTVTVSAPAMTDTFAETLYSGLNATGSILSQGKTSATIVAGTANTVSLTLSGVIASLSVAVSNATPTAGTPASIGLTVNFNDASNDAIIGPATFATPVTLTDTDSSGATQLTSGTTSAATLTLNKPSDAASLGVSYSGATNFTKAVIAASAGANVASSATITAQPAATPPPNSAGFNDYVTFGYDNGRDVYNPNSTAITPASVPNIHLGWQTSLADYNTQSQPILATEIPGHAGVLFAGGGSGGVKAYDALTGNKIWNANTGQETYTCENSSTIYFGVGGSVAYDPASKSIYVVGNQNSAPNATATNALYHFDAASGNQLGVVNFAPALAGWNSLDFSHTSVTLGANGLAYVGTGATCDISSWRGRVAAISVPSMQLANTFFTVWNGTTQPWGGGGVWGWGGVSIDPAGNVLTGVGNTDNGTTSHGSIVPPFQKSPEEYSGYGEALIKLTASLSGVEDSNHPLPTTSYTGGSVDLDLQGTPAIFTPTGCPTMAAVQGKAGTIFLYQESNLAQGPVGQFALAPSSYQDSFLGGPAFSEASGLLYEAVPSSQGSLYPPGMIAINPGCGYPSVAWHSAFGPDSGSAGVPRSVPAASAGGVVFVGTPCTSDGNGGCGTTYSSSKIVSRTAQSVRRKPAICCSPAGSGEGALWALRADNGEVLNGGEPLIITSGPIRVPPTIDGNWIFVLDNNGDMYGLTIDSSYPAVAEKSVPVDARMLRQWEPAPHN